MEISLKIRANRLQLDFESRFSKLHHKRCLYSFRYHEKKEKEILNLIFQEFHDFDLNPLVPNSSMIAFLMSGCGLDYCQVLSSSLNS